MVRYIKATDLTTEQRQCLEEAIKNDAHAERRWSAEALFSRITPCSSGRMGRGCRSAVDIPCG